jgi:hypothetical protein
MNAGLVNNYQGSNQGNQVKKAEEDKPVAQAVHPNGQQHGAQPQFNPLANFGHGFGQMYGGLQTYQNPVYQPLQSYASPMYGSHGGYPNLQQSATSGPSAISPYQGSSLYAANMPYAAPSNYYGASAPYGAATGSYNGYGYPYGQGMTPEATQAIRSLMAPGSDMSFFRNLPYQMF